MKRQWVFGTIILFLIGLIYFFILPRELFNDPYATVIESRSGELLGAQIADDGQWRFPASQRVSEKFRLCITYYEDQYFFRHPGVNPVSLFRAMGQNIKSRKIVSGGSTLTMQVIRLSRKKNRTIIEKLYEMILATRLELRYSKEEILNIYASHAPFGGNVVGLESASWRYYGRSADLLSWAESAALAVLPNNPGMVYPGKNQLVLQRKRDFLLKKLFQNQVIDSLTYQLALTEPLPGTPKSLPQTTAHLLQKLIREGKKGERITVSLDSELQKKTLSIVESHVSDNRYNKIYNAAAIVVKVETGEVLTYIGNTSENQREHNAFVDVIPSYRSTGSILKPFLYAGMLNEGFITPAQLYPDIPVFFDSFSPKNYVETYDGAVPANEALARSLNIPSVFMLKDYSYEKFHYLLRKLGLKSVNKPPSHYGLSLILGGAEASLWDLTAAYAGMARTLQNYNQYVAPYRYDDRDFRGNTVLPVKNREEGRKKGNSMQPGILNAQSTWFTFEAMLDVNRPSEEASWKLFDSSRKVAWKTGTSFGFRDAWAIGVTPEYVVGVWVGNADGEGRPGLTGLYEAAPLMFDIYNILPQTSWFRRPVDGIVKTSVCKFSGYRAGIHCPETAEKYLPQTSLKTRACPYCTIVHLDRAGNMRVLDECYSTAEMVHKKWFVLPPVMEWYYQKKNPFYRKVPELKPGCGADTEGPGMEMIYPKNNSIVYIPRSLDGSVGEVIFEVAHSAGKVNIHWHLDKEYLGTTNYFHHLAVSAQPGSHTLTLVDEKGKTLECKFKVLERGSD